MQKLIYLFVIIVSLGLALNSCHTETPTAVDLQAPTAELLMVYRGSDTLFNVADTSKHNSIFSTANHSFKVRVSDNRSVYKVKLMAKDPQTKKSYLVSQIIKPGNNTVEFSVNYRNFPIVQSSDFQLFELYAKVCDKNELSDSTTAIAFKIPKPNIWKILSNEFGRLTLVDSTKSVDFFRNTGKLVFIHFIGKGCLGCIDEGIELKDLYNRAEFDTTKCYIATFGSGYTAKSFIEQRRSIKGFSPKIHDFFLDGGVDGSEGRIDEFFDILYGEDKTNAVYAVLPDGQIKIYDFMTTAFPTWVEHIYSTYLPKSK